MNETGRKTITELEAGMNNISTEISVTMMGGVPEAMSELGNMCMPGNLRANNRIMYNMLTLILFRFEILISPGIIRVMKRWRMMRCPSQSIS